MEKIVINNEFFLYKATSRKFVIFVHGLVESMDGYIKVKDFLVNNGINVILYNNRAHGENAQTLGHLELYDSYKIINDVIEIEKYVKDNLNPEQVTIVGHSMGTAIVRAAMKSVRFDKVVLNGGGGSISPTFSNLVLGMYLFVNNKKPSKLFNNIIFKSFNKTVTNPVSENDWISTNSEYVATYNADPYCGFIGTGSFYQEQIRLVAMAREIDIKATKVFITSGSEDPVTKMGKECYILKDKLVKQGCEVEVKLYSGKRHFIYDELNCEECYDDLLQFVIEV